MTSRELQALRREIERHEFLWINDEVWTNTNAGPHCGFAVHDRRLGKNTGAWINSLESLAYLVRHGAEAWCESQFNGGVDPLAALAGALTASTLAAILADLDEHHATTREQHAALARAKQGFAEQLAALEGEDAADRLRPEFKTGPGGRMKVQYLA